MRVHLVSEHASPLAALGGVDAGGQNVHVAALARALAAQGDTVVVHTRRDDPTLPRYVPLCPGVVVDHVDAGPAGPVPKDDLLPYMGSFADVLLRRWRTQRPDVVHAHFWMSGLAAVNAAAPLRIPTMLTFHALGSEKQRHQGADDTSPAGRVDYEAWLARNVNAVICTTAAEARAVVAMGARESNVHVVPCGVDLDRFRTDGPRRPKPGGRPRVVCVSRLVPRKGIADLIVAVAGLPNVELLIAGGPRRELLAADAHARELKALIERHGASRRIRLLGGIERERVPALMRSADVVACAPWYEPFGLTAVEGLACGVPVVATAVGGLAETVVDGRTGLLVPPRDPLALRGAIECLLADSDRRRAMGAAGRRRAQWYGWDQVAARTHEIAAATVVAREPASDRVFA
ncbi:MAG: glycosyltransferase [Acidimicrobiia bacterium]